MTEYIIKTTDIKDELLAPVVVAANEQIKEDDVVNSYLQETEEYIADLVNSVIGAEISDLETIPYKLKQLAIAYTCKCVCIRKSFSGANAYRNQAEDVTDRWAQKFVYYNKLVASYESAITPELLTGKRPVGQLGISLERG